MALLPIIIAPDARLKTVTKPVAAIDDGIRRLLDDMLETMYHAPGIGLAAPQVGILQRLIVMDLADEGDTPRPLRIVNPEIAWKSETLSTYNEGCLSIPEVYADIERPAGVEVKYLDETGAPRTLRAEGLMATCLQHEIDHLNGVLFTDYLSPLKRNMIMRRMEKAKKAGEFD
jgi:peptide deformylase